MRGSREKAVEAKLKTFRGVCKESGIRLTHQRLELFREIAAADDHPSAEDIYRRTRTRMPTISLDTVYRTLATFERRGVISRLQALGEKGRFDPNPSPHNHLVCVRCKKVQDFHWSAFGKLGLPSESKGWGRVESKHAELRGLCRECLREERKKPQC
jgi:Fur family peroxide stress response transcriptional regulator